MVHTKVGEDFLPTCLVQKSYKEKLNLRLNHYAVAIYVFVYQLSTVIGRRLGLLVGYLNY
jgi:hypothetical protein